MRGVVFYDGPSQYTDEPIVAIATFKSSNRKTGDVIQTWILSRDTKPTDALVNGEDVHVCGNCVHRPQLGNTCYVQVGQAPNGVWKSYQSGLYPTFSESEHASYFGGRVLRGGSYGDPAAVPWSAWAPLVDLADSALFYSHGHVLGDLDPQFRSTTMASADTPQQAKRLHAQGWRTFRVKRPDEPLLDNEIYCKYTTEALTCDVCLECGNKGSGVNIAIDIHGAKAGNFRLLKVKQLAA